MVQLEELTAIKEKFSQGLAKLELLGRCLDLLQKRHGLGMQIDPVDEREGELAFWFAGAEYYVKIRITDRNVDNVGVEYKVPIGWLDWGRYGERGERETPELSDHYDERGILCELEKEEFYCDFHNCDDGRIDEGLLLKLQRLVEKTIAVNNIR